MLKAIRQNPTIAAGILLPVVVAVFFVLATAIPRWAVAPPQHGLLFTSYNYQHAAPAIEVRFDVVGQKLRARAYTAPEHYRNVPRLHRFDPATDSVREIHVELPSGPAGFEDGMVLEIPELAGVRISPASRAPDGYEVTGPGHRGRGLMGLLFGRRPDPAFAISKNGAVFDIPHVKDSRFYYGSVSFLGWVLDSDD